MPYNDQNEFLSDKPALTRVLSVYGDMLVSDYVSLIYHTYQKMLTDARKHELHTVLDRLSEKVLQKSYPLTSDLLNTGITSTADHHGVLTHPFFLSANYARAQCLKDTYTQHTLTTLSCAGISLSNNSFPRGYLYTDETGTEIHMPFLSLKHKNMPVYCAPKIDKKSITRELDKIHLAQLPPLQKKHIITFLKQLQNDTHLDTLADFDEQATYINYLFFKHIPGFADIDLFYISQESVVRELLLGYHITGDTVISQLLYNTEFHTLFKKHFNGLVGAFDTDKHTGTELFWGIQNHTRIGLCIENGFLVSQNKTVSIALTPEALRNALQEKSLMPSMALTFIVLSFYYGVICGGGYSQVDYLGNLQNAWHGMLHDVSASVHVDISSIPTGIYFGDLAFLKHRNTYFMKGLDLFFLNTNFISTETLNQDFTSFYSILNS